VNISNAKSLIFLAAVAVIVFMVQPQVFAGAWEQVSSDVDGIYGAVISCSQHGDTQIHAWIGCENAAPRVDTYEDCTTGRVYSRGNVAKTFRWVPTDPKTDPPPFRQYVRHTIGLTHVANGQPSGSASCSLGSPTMEDPYHVIAYSWENTRSGELTLSYSLDADVEVGPSSTASVCVAVESVEIGVSCPGPGAQFVKVSPSNYRAMPMYPASVRRVTNYANFPPGDPVNLATGEHVYSPNPDINVYNPYGPAVIYQRNYLSSLAADAKHSPGLPIGWNDGFDMRVVAGTPSAWGDLKLVYPNDAEETASPVLSSGVPTGNFTVAAGREYMVTGTPSTTVGQWDQLTITHKDRVKWRFSRASSDTYLLSAIANRMGNSINMVRDSQNGNRITAVQDDQPTPATLLTCSYDDGCLSLLTDCYGRKVSYSYFSLNNTMCLRTVSQLSASDAAPARSTYDYQFLGNSSVPHLNRVSVPSPAGNGQTAEEFDIDGQGRVTAITDGNYNVHHFYYNYPDATRVVVQDAQGKAEQDFLVSFDIGHSNILTSVTDRNGGVAKRQYTDTSNPFLPTKMTDKLNKTVETTYDQYGNILTVKSARGTITRYVYDYDAFALGRLRTIKEADNLTEEDPARKPDTSVSYYEPSGLVQSITYPQPGTTGPAAERVTTSFTYDLADDQIAGTRGLGNILTMTGPGNNATISIAKTFYYGPYAQVRVGLPLSITDNLNHSALLTYDARGNVKSTADALGNKVDFIYNAADQITSILQPHTAALP
jgi:YD repeat-containing protein